MNQFQCDQRYAKALIGIGLVSGTSTLDCSLDWIIGGYHFNACVKSQEVRVSYLPR